MEIITVNSVVGSLHLFKSAPWQVETAALLYKALFLSAARNIERLLLLLREMPTWLLSTPK